MTPILLIPEYVGTPALADMAATWTRAILNGAKAPARQRAAGQPTRAQEEMRDGCRGFVGAVTGGAL